MPILSPSIAVMLRRLLTNKKPLVIVPVVLVLILIGLFLPVRKVSIEPYGILSLETKITLTVGEGVAYASPAEYLQNPSFTGGSTGWTLDTTTYDPDVFQDSPGSIKTITVVGRNKTVTGTCSQTIATDIGSSDTVKLSLWWKKGYTSSVASQDLKAQIALPSDPTTFIDIWSDTQTGDIDWTAVTEVDVSSYFTEPGTYQFCYYMYVANPNDPSAQVWAWIDNTHLDVTPAVPPDITNTPTSKAFGTVNTSTDYWTKGPAPTFPLDDTECYFTVTNNSSVTAKIAIRATDFSGGIAGGGWDLGSTPAGDTVVLKAGKSGDAEGDMVTLTTIDQTFIASLDALASKMWELKMETPTSFSNGDPKTSTVTLTAMFP